MKHGKRLIQSIHNQLEPLENRQLFAAGGVLDKSFSQDGLVTFPFLAGGTEFSRDTAVQSDGKTVVVGEHEAPDLTRPGNFIRKVAVARFNFDGTPDKTFGTFKTGKMTFDIGSRDFSGANSVAIQGDGKIVIGGYAQTGSHFFDFDFAVIRLMPDGKLDTSFDGDGMRTIDLGGDFAEITDLTVQGDGKIVVVGENQNGDFNFGVARLNTNGSLDSSFDGDGKRQVDFGSEDFPEAVTIGSSGKIIIVGSSGTDEFGTTLSFDGSARRVAVTRLNSNGSQDASFGTNGNGKVLTSFPQRKHSKARGVTVQPSGKIVVVGATGDVTTPNGVDFMIARYTTDGRLDTSFGAAHTGLVEVGFGAADQAFDVIQSLDGGLVVAGTSSNVGIGVTKLTADGALDTSFAFQGKKTIVANVSAFNRGSVGLAKGTGMRRFVVTGGRDFTTARFLDAGANVVSIGSFDPNASEQGRDPATIIVTRTERLPFATPVFLNIGGTAIAPTGPAGEVDYDLAGISLPFVFNGHVINSLPFVNIPAGQTFATFTLTPRDDLRSETSEVATFTIAPSGGGLTFQGQIPYEIGTNPSATIDIFDNDQVIFATRHAFKGSSHERLSLFSDDQIAAMT